MTMANFRYRAVTGAGQLQEGVRQGASESSVARELQTMGLVPLYIGAASGTAVSGVHGQADLSWRLSALLTGGRRHASERRRAARSRAHNLFRTHGEQRLARRCLRHPATRQVREIPGGCT